MKIQFIYLLLISLMLSCGSSKSLKVDSDDREAIIAVFKMQEREWSDNDIEGFMQGYWKSDDLKFYSSNGLTSGYNRILENYKVKYPNRDHTGTLDLEIDNISRISEDSYYVMGRYELDRKAGDAKGNFMVIFKKIDGRWKIIADMST